MVDKALFSSEKTEWETPQDLFNELYREFGFTLDVCATAENAKCQKYFTPEIDGLKQDWSRDVFWMNPPYNEPEQPCKPNCKKKRCKKRGFHVYEYVPGAIDWVKKACMESQKGATGVGLLPARTDVKYFHKYIWDGKNHCPKDGIQIRLLEGRLKFGGAKNSAPFPSMVVVFRPKGVME